MSAFTGKMRLGVSFSALLCLVIAHGFDSAYASLRGSSLSSSQKDVLVPSADLESMWVELRR